MTLQLRLVSSMAVMIGQASSDERGRYVGGAAGNQSGTELNMRAYYNMPWDRGLIRFKSGTAAAKCAAAMRAAVGNMNIGYDQGQRNTLLPLARAAGWDLSKVYQACETDCSALAGVCGIAAGAPEGAIYAGGNLCYTGNIVERFRATGLVEVFGAGYAASASNLQDGDILVSSSHAVVVVSGGMTPQGGSASTSNTASNSSFDVDALARAVIAGRYGTGAARRAALGDKYEAVQARVNELLARTPNAAGTSTGAARIIAGEYKVVASSLNVRAKPSLGGAVVASYSRGERIYSIAADTVAADGYVWAHYTAFSGATRYVAVGTADGSEKYLVKVLT